MTYLRNVLVAIDQLAGALLGVPADCTISAYCWILHMRGTSDIPYRVVDALFFWDERHCERSWLSEVRDRYQPPEARSGK